MNLGLITYIRRNYYKILQKQDVFFTRLAIHAMKWLGKSRQPIHPKHLFDSKRASVLQEAMSSGISFLDIGAGMGSECLKASELGAHYIAGIEQDPKCIAAIESRASEKNANIKVFNFNLESAKFPFENESFDLINFSNVLEHLHNRIAVLKEVKRVKKITGRVLISIPTSETSWKKKLRAVGLDSRDDDDHKIEYTKEALQDELEQAGLKIISDLYPIIPSFPWNGIFAFSAAFSPRLYRYLQERKHSYVQRHPEESIGWAFFVQ